MEGIEARVLGGGAKDRFRNGMDEVFCGGKGRLVMVMVVTAVITIIIITDLPKILSRLISSILSYSNQQGHIPSVDTGIAS